MKQNIFGTFENDPTFENEAQGTAGLEACMPGGQLL